MLWELCSLGGEDKYFVELMATDRGLWQIMMQKITDDDGHKSYHAIH